MLSIVNKVKWPQSRGELHALLVQLTGLFAVIIGLVLPISTSLTEIFSYAAIFFALASGVVFKNWRVVIKSHIGLFMLLLYLLLVVSITYSKADLSHSIAFLFKYNKLLIGVLLMTIFVDKRWREYALWALMLSIATVTVLSLIKGGYGWLFHNGAINADIAKDYISQSFCVAIGGYLFMLAAFQYKKYRWLFVLMSILAIIDVLIFTAARSGYVMLALLFMVFFWQHYGAKWLLVALVGLCLMFSFAFVVSPVFNSRVSQGFENYHKYHQGDVETSVGERVSFALGGLKVVKAHPIIGAGVGSFGKEFKAANSNMPVTTVNPHNEYLNIAAQLGVLGVALMLVMFVAGWWQSALLPTYYQYIAQAIISVLFVGAALNSWLMDVTEGYMFIYLVAIVFAAIPLTVTSKQTSAAQ